MSVWLGILVLFFLGGAYGALYFGLVVGLGRFVIRRMPCGKAGMMVFFMAAWLVGLTHLRQELGEAGFYLGLVWGWGELFFTYRQAALVEGCGAGGCSRA